MGLLYHLARKMDEKFPLITNGNCTINVRAKLRLLTTTFPWRGWQRNRFAAIIMILVVKIIVSSVPVIGVAQTNLGSYVDSTVTVGNQREFFIHFTGWQCGSPLSILFLEYLSRTKMSQNSCKVISRFLRNSYILLKFLKLFLKLFLNVSRFIRNFFKVPPKQQKFLLNYFQVPFPA